MTALVLNLKPFIVSNEGVTVLDNPATVSAGFTLPKFILHLSRIFS